MAALSLYLLLTWIFLLSLFRTRFAEVLCHADESFALMEFKRSFRTNTTDWRCIHPKVHSWSLDGSGDCCSWDGVECDEVTGRVIALNLSSSLSLGTMSPNTTLFRLVHMESLNLAFNNFNFSSIPYGFSNLSKLQYLNLSSSNFSGEIPRDISQLSKLVSLDLSTYWDETLRMPNMGGFVHNLTGLKELDLSRVSLLSPLPPMLANFSSLTLLRLVSCELSGNFPVSIFQLPNLEVLSVADNYDLSGFFPKPHWGSPLKSLEVSWTNFSGEIPSLIGNLSLLNELRAENCYFSGSLPSSMGNLSHLTILDFYANNLQGQIPVSFANLTQLLELQLSNNNLQGPVPVSFANLTQLSKLYLSDNNLSGDFLEWVVNLTKLTSLDISGNWFDFSSDNLHNDILGPLRNLKDLYVLNLESLNLNGVLNVNDLFALKNLRRLVLSNNNISFTKSFINATTSKLINLELDSCNLTEFPQFIGYLSKLEGLYLQHNRIQGTIPRGMWNNSKESLRHVDLSHNLLTGFENNQTNLSLPNLDYLDISSNLLKTTLPVPPPSVIAYNISNNFLFGEVPTSICEVSSLTVLDLSNNTLNGTLPPCLGSIHPLILLNLARNKLDGMIPHVYLDDCALRMIDLRENQLSGIVPRSLGNCRMLEYLNLGDNQINDTFPFWLSELTYLKVIGLRSNNFHGPIESKLSQLNFTSLHILDISNNSFNGEFPSNLLKSCHAMKVMVGQDNLAYLDIFEMPPHASFYISTTYAMKLMNKGVKREYAKIPDVLIAIDLSNNKFEGFIPELIGDLESLRMLNLSNNLFNGSIPPSLANLTVLEALDLSRNNLVGEIPQQLARLTFLSVFNISHNHLSGPIPLGTQFDTFESSSFAMNNGLCGSPLPNKCTNGEDAPPPPSFKVDNEEDCLFNLDWRIMLVGAGVGFSVGIVIENLIIDEKRTWFLCCSKKMAKGWKKMRKALADKKLCS
ncbi:receptor-like protein 7 [Eucalyptus grandis]|uniref:receptor-like protein 7 n=1 Tax=Eucalyptus grandis TaxID=71139 RepID=UPI00192E9A9A|nr:receptor-like protein 7 [Eucalyptus grandis]